MQIKLRDIAAGIGISHKTLSLYMTGVSRTELTSRKISDYTGLPWQHLQKMSSENIEAILYQTHLDKKYTWLKDIKNPNFDYENICSECA